MHVISNSVMMMIIHEETSVLVSGHGPAMNSTLLHGSAAAAAADREGHINFMYSDDSKVADNSTRTHDAQ